MPPGRRAERCRRLTRASATQKLCSGNSAMPKLRRTIWNKPPVVPPAGVVWAASSLADHPSCRRRASQACTWA
eukprot:3041950-Pyramimonas_sp.AAC.1